MCACDKTKFPLHDIVIWKGFFSEFVHTHKFRNVGKKADSAVVPCLAEFPDHLYDGAWDLNVTDCSQLDCSTQTHQLCIPCNNHT